MRSQRKPFVPICFGIVPASWRRKALVELAWPPSVRFIGVQGRSLLENRIHDSPSFFHVVLPRKQRGVAGNGIAEYSPLSTRTPDRLSRALSFALLLI